MTRTRAHGPTLLAAVALLCLACLGSCRLAGDAGRAPAQAAGDKLRVVATTNILGDVVANVGGDHIALTVLMGIGVDPHTYVPTPSDSVAIHDAHLVLASGAGLEEGLEEMLRNAGGSALRLQVSDGLDVLAPPVGGEGTSEPGTAGSVDPHVWFAVPNVIHWVETIEQALSRLDPAHAPSYRQNAGAYTLRLEELDSWIREQIAGIPGAKRRLVTNHPAFGYLAARYGLEQVGAVYPVSPASEPSAQEIAALQDAIRSLGVPAIFTENTVSPDLAEQVAGDTGVRLVRLYTGSLGGPGSGAETYDQMMRYDVMAIVDALR